MGVAHVSLLDITDKMIRDMHYRGVPHIDDVVGVANAGHEAFGKRCQHVLEGVVFTCVDGYERELSDESIPCLIQM